MATYGENLVASLIEKLPKDEFEGFSEVHISTTTAAHKSPDFVILSITRGLFVVEVKDYKEILDINHEFIRIRRNSGEIVQESNPLGIAEKYAHNLVKQFEKFDELLRTHQGKRKLKFPWIPTAFLPHIPQHIIGVIEDGGVFPKNTVLGKESLTPNTFESALRTIPSRWKMENQLGDETRKVVRGVLKPHLVLSDISTGRPIGVMSRQQEEEVYRPIQREPQKDQYQQTLIQFDESVSDELLSAEAKTTIHDTGIRLVRGVAGSGKSLVLAKRAEFLASTYPEKQLLLLAFNKDLILDFKRRIKGVPHIEIRTFHQLCHDILGKNWHEPVSPEGWIAHFFNDSLIEHDLDSHYVAEEFEWREETNLHDSAKYLNAKREGRQRPLSKAKREAINQIYVKYQAYLKENNRFDWATVSQKALELLQPASPFWQRYDIVLIDEAQDFAPSWISVVKKVLKPDGILFMCDDPSQALFRSFSWKRKGIDVMGRTRVLKVPFRNTEQITVAAVSLIEANQKIQKNDDYVLPDLKATELRQGEKPILVGFNDAVVENEFMEKFIYKMLSMGIQPHNIAILCHDSNHVHFWKKYTVKHKIYVESFRKMKGLEFEVVIIPGLHTAFKDYLSSPEEIMERRRHMYTAMTRAREILIMTFQGIFPPELEPILPYVSMQEPFTSSSSKL